ncbi:MULTISPECIES: gephyrin-like molybdotransferase Glp [Mumia]|uniref:molybdotransferase-like divisome protein Glp n=1 Tax=Mumia TaxID=1546255 RepID=UPI0014231496|nr:MULTISPECIES: gephyrin-like molybdotransferase Glp [unclassified Mumia]QMW67086.1 molybdopterin molybdotransferase MoeA [Mumia sp. ZJ1417]
MRTVDEHLEKLLDLIGPLQPYDQPLLESLGLPLVDDVVSPIDLPRFTNSAMDGYAVRAADVVGANREFPVVLPVVGEQAAGSSTPTALTAKTAVKIMTGAPIPSGADTVVPIELTDGGDADVRIYQARRAGENVRPAGEDVAAGEIVAEAGTILGPREVGLLASLGFARLRARPRPRVVVLSTGAELREPGARLDYDSIYDGNSYMLAACARAAGAIAYRVGITSDDPREFADKLNDQLVRADLVVTSGGISKGAYDVVKAALSELGTVEFAEVAMQPGKPQGFGTVGEEKTPIVTLPGNPVSSYVSFEVFVLPMLRRMMGKLPYRRPLVQATMTEEIRSPSGRRQFLRGWLEVNGRGVRVTRVSGPGSHLVAGLARANCLIVVEEDETALHVGDTAKVMFLDREF